MCRSVYVVGGYFLETRDAMPLTGYARSKSRVYYAVLPVLDALEDTLTIDWAKSGVFFFIVVVADQRPPGRLLSLLNASAPFSVSRGV
jgi:hypothetical protein